MQAVGARVSGHRAFMLVSVRSRLFSTRWPVLRDALIHADIPLTYVLLDGLEKFNTSVLADAEFPDLERAIAAVRRRLEETPCLAVWTWGDVERQPRFAGYTDAIADCYRENAHFRRATMNQSYRNLQPRLKAANIRNSRDARMHTLAQYLLNEIACKLLLGQERLFQCEVLPVPEMPVMKAIYAGQYAELAPLIRQPPSYNDKGALSFAAFAEDCFK